MTPPLSLRAAEQACRDIPLTLPSDEYKRRMDAAMADWQRANLAMFDAQVAQLEWPQCPGEEASR